MTYRGNCLSCAHKLRDANAIQLAERRGPYFEHWYESMRRSFEFPRYEEPHPER